ncbi:hypothetical protein [Actinomycetospora corticicola]|uniref:Uncharacterized protein n=1 Tax=Actinomycetospora corticicola TaxID=663602 RepID=A0A7Y9DWG6_9PSEU|nr:hypothetical protein [Actinomycetospora corticicola]NYD36793.1 hypothetical protein [Actinomycetospora corticicola]
MSATRLAAEYERQRDDARGAKDQALSQLAATREAHEVGQRAAAKLDGSIEATRDVLREGGFPTDSSMSLADDVSRALGKLRESTLMPGEQYFPNVKGRCPSCGGSSLFVGVGGHITCGRVDCGSPEAADQLLAGDDPWRHALAELRLEVRAARDVLAPDVSTAGTPLDEVARTALRVARATSVAAELRWWVEPGNAPGQDMVPRALLAKRAAGLDPGGGTPEGRQPPTPSISHDDFEVRGTEPRVPHAVPGRSRAAERFAMDIIGEAVADAGQRQCDEDAKASYSVEVLAALRAADRAGEVHAQPRYRIVHPTDLSYTEALVVLARAVRAYGEQPDDEPVADEQVEQVAREAARVAVVHGGVEADHHADDVVDALARAGFVPGVYPPGMAIDGDLLRTLIADALPRRATDEFAGELADSVLDAAVRAGFTILHGTNLAPRTAPTPTHEWAGYVSWTAWTAGAARAVGRRTGELDLDWCSDEFGRWVEQQVARDAEAVQF